VHHYVGAVNRDALIALIKPDPRPVALIGLNVPDGKIQVRTFHAKERLELLEITGARFVEIASGAESGCAGIAY